MNVLQGLSKPSQSPQWKDYGNEDRLLPFNSLSVPVLPHTVLPSNRMQLQNLASCSMYVCLDVCGTCYALMSCNHAKRTNKRAEKRKNHWCNHFREGG